jgi:hypothetical protein
MGQKWGLRMAWEKNPERVAINQHLHRMHEGYAASGDTLARNVAHDLIHDAGVDGWAGKPLHRHIEGELSEFEVKPEEE